MEHNKFYSWLYYIHAFFLVLVGCVIWGLVIASNPHLDGVAVYKMSSMLPTDDLSKTFPKAGDSNRTKNTFGTEAMLLP